MVISCSWKASIMRVTAVVALASAVSSRLRWLVTGSAGAGVLEALADLGADQRGVGEQGGDVVPDDGVEVVGADRLVPADPPAVVAVVIAAQAPVVVDLLAGGAGRGRGSSRSRRPSTRPGPAAARGPWCCGTANRLLSASRCPARLKVSRSMMAGTAISIHSSRGRSTVLNARGAERPSRRARRFSPRDSCRTWSCRTPRARVGGVTQHAPDHGAVPAGLAGPGRGVRW